MVKRLLTQVVLVLCAVWGALFGGYICLQVLGKISLLRDLPPLILWGVALDRVGVVTLIGSLIGAIAFPWILVRFLRSYTHRKDLK